MLRGSLLPRVTCTSSRVERKNRRTNDVCELPRKGIVHHDPQSLRVWRQAGTPRRRRAMGWAFTADCTVTRLQYLKLQEAPETVPEGSTPQTVNLVCYDTLVDVPLPVRQ